MITSRHYIACGASGSFWSLGSIPVCVSRLWSSSQVDLAGNHGPVGGASLTMPLHLHTGVFLFWFQVHFQRPLAGVSDGPCLLCNLSQSHSLPSPFLPMHTLSSDWRKPSFGSNEVSLAWELRRSAFCCDVGCVGFHTHLKWARFPLIARLLSGFLFQLG